MHTKQGKDIYEKGIEMIEGLTLFLQVTFVVLGFVVMIMVQLIENYTTGATAVTGTGVS